MENMQELLARKSWLTATMRMMDRNAHFDTEEVGCMLRHWSSWS